METDRKKLTGRKKNQGSQRIWEAKKAEESPAPALDPKFVGYFRRVKETLEQDFESEEDRALFIRNVFKEVKGNERAVATNVSASITMQKLLALASSAQLCQFLDVLSKSWQTICWHRTGSHVVETALLQYERLQGAEEENDDDDDDEDGGEPCSSLDDLILSLCAEVKSKFLPYNQNTHGSFIVRTLFQVLSGTVLCKDPKKGGQGSTVQSEFDVPPSFLEELQEMSGLFKADIGVFATHELASLGMQTALVVLHRKSPPACTALCDDVLGYLSTRNVSGPGRALLVFLKDETSSRLFEKILEVSEQKQLNRLYKAQFKGQLRELSAHPIANYTVQRLIRAIQSKKLFSAMFEELSSGIEDVLAKGHMGIITTLVEGCRRLGRHQMELVTHLMEAFHCATPNSRQITCVLLFLSLLTYEIYYKIEDEEEPSEHKENPDVKLQSVNYHGSILLQHLLHFEDPAIVLHSLGNMSEADLHTVACSQAGSHIFDVLFDSATISKKQKKKVLQKLKAHCMELACNKYGSRVLERVWNTSTMGVKEEIAQRLVERLRELQNDPIGHHIARNFALNHFVKRRKVWEEHQQVEKKRRKMFADILED
ncbi:nucleolar protein 9 isoform 1-T2 [Anomaloglossus baeobatrachus]|uniref:nucleolar protein 9 n=1 Tax=Anomaloglossus baeobatrachus TaxID=238106 RepID=UPI003F4FD8ED